MTRIDNIHYTDLAQRNASSPLPAIERRAQLTVPGARFETEFAYFEGSGPVVVCGRTVEALGLEEAVLDKFLPR